MTDLLKTQNLKKQFISGDGKKLLVLDQVCMQIPANSFNAIFGKSGSGKSTLLHLLGGLESPSAGEILFLGQDLSALSSNALAQWRNREVGFVFQFHHLLKDFTALENVMLPSLIHNPASKPAKAAELLEKMQLKDRMMHRPTELSGGEQQRVAIARALINQPKVVLADEPTGNLDHKTEKAVLNLLLQTCREQQTTLVIVTHNTDIQTVMDNCFYLHQHKLSKEQA